MDSSSRSHIRATCTALLVTVGATGCFVYDRGRELEPGQIQGRAVFADGSAPAEFARVLPEGAGLVRRADAQGRFDVKGLGAGSYVLRLTSDNDGDGVPERGALRAVTLSPYDKDGVTTLPYLILGDVPLSGTGEVSGRVVDGDDPAQPPVAGAKVLLLRDAASVPTLLDALPPDAELGAEATTATDDDGMFRVAGLVTGSLKLVALTGGASPKISAPAQVEITAGGDAALGDVEIVEPEGSREVNVGVGFDGPASVVGVFRDPAGSDPDLRAADARSTAGSPAAMDVPFGVWDVRGLDDEGARQGVLLAQVAYPGAGQPLTWGLMLVREGDPCAQPQGAVRFDIDGDGVRGLPNPEDDFAPWRRCAEACASAFGTRAGSPACEVDGTTFDCDDDGDLQPDVTEPYACVGLCGGTDLDGDGICDAADPMPRCASNDAADPLCDRDDPPDFVPPRPLAEYAEQTDAGVPIDAGDGGAVVLDAGLTDGGAPTDAGAPPDAGAQSDAGASIDAGFVVDAGGPPLDVPWVTTFGELSFNGGRNIARAVLVDGPLVYVAGELGSAALIGVGTTCALGGPTDVGAAFVAVLDERGGCQRAHVVKAMPDFDGYVTMSIGGMANTSAGLVVVGTTYGAADFGTTPGGAQLTAGTYDYGQGFVVAFDAQLRPTRLLSIGDGSNDATVTAVEALDVGGFAIAGIFQGVIDLGGATTPMTATAISSGDLFVGRFGATGDAVAALQGGAVGTTVEATALGALGDGLGSFVVGGRIESAMMFAGALTVDAASSVAAYFARIGGTTNTIEWTRSIATPNDATIDDIAVAPGGAQLALAGSFASTATVQTAASTFDLTSVGLYDAFSLFVDPQTGYPSLPTDVAQLAGSTSNDYAVAHDVHFTGPGELLVVGDHFGPLSIPRAGAPLLLAGAANDASGHAFVARLQRDTATGAWRGATALSTRSFTLDGGGTRIGAATTNAQAYAVATLFDGSPIVVGELDGVVGFGDLFRRTEQVSALGDFNVSSANGFVWRLLPDVTSPRDVQNCFTSACANSDEVCDPRTLTCVPDCGHYDVAVCPIGDACDARAGLCGRSCNANTLCAGSMVCAQISGTCLPSCQDIPSLCRVGCCSDDGQCGDLGAPLAVQNDTSAVQGATFTPLSPASTPPGARARAAFAAMPGGGLLFGGLDATGVAYTDTWRWVGSDWVPQGIDMSEPNGFVDVAMSFSPLLGQVALVGGRVDETTSTANDDERLFNATAGTWAFDCCNSFPASLYGAAYAGGFVFGGIDLGLVSGTTYQEANTNGLEYQAVAFATSPPPRWRARMVQDPNSGAVVMYGGIDRWGAVLNDTWELTGTSALTWTEVSASPPPRARVDAMMAWDGGAILLIGGTDDRGAPQDDVFRYDGPAQGWTSIGALPQARTAASMAFDDAAGTAILFGGLVEKPAICAVGAPEQPPAGWTCPSPRFGDGFCDCGCGIPDADCALPGAGCDDNCLYPTFLSPEDPTRCAYASCGNQILDPGELCDDVADLTCDPKTCFRVTPPQWTCEQKVYDARDFNCDCGCGALDPDCPSASKFVCSTCTGEGSCAQPVQDFCNPIDEFDNAVCIVPG